MVKPSWTTALLFAHAIVDSPFWPEVYEYNALESELLLCLQNHARGSQLHGR